MDKNLQVWVYTAQIEHVIARFNSAQGTDRDHMINAVRSATLQAIRNNDYARSSDLITAFPNMRHWENADDRLLKAETRKDLFYGILKNTVVAFAIGATFYALNTYGFSLGPLRDVHLVYWLTGISIVLNSLGWHFRAGELFAGRRPDNSSMEQTIGEWLSIGGSATLILALLSSLAQLIWLA